MTAPRGEICPLCGGKRVCRKLSVVGGFLWQPTLDYLSQDERIPCPVCLGAPVLWVVER